MRYLGQDKAVQQTLSELEATCGPDITVVDADRKDDVGPGKIVVAKALENREIVELAVDNGARHVVQLPNLDFSRQLIFSAQIIATPEAFFNHPYKFLVDNGERSLLSNPLQVWRYPTSHFPSKDAILEQLAADLQTVPRLGSGRHSVTSVADEMLMNIIKDAPKYFSRNFPNLDAKNRSSQLLMAHDKDRLLLWTEDDYGSLNIDKLLGRLRECYQGDQATPLNVEGDGAGLGCRIIFDLSVAMSIFVKPGQKTVFCALLPIGKSNRQQQEMPKNLHILGLSF